MAITYGDHLIDSGYYDITPEQERELWARAECKRRGIDPDANCADGGIDAWMIVAKEAFGSPPSDDELDEILDEFAAENEAWRDGLYDAQEDEE